LRALRTSCPSSWTTAGESGLTRGQTPSTHTIKTPIERLDHTVVNEAFCPMVGRQLGADVVDASTQRVAGQEFLRVKRYDRREFADGIMRLHQEDFCQALGVPSARKYQAEGGPSLIWRRVCQGGTSKFRRELGRGRGWRVVSGGRDVGLGDGVASLKCGDLVIPHGPVAAAGGALL
jgi:hypothetical protein